MCVVFTGNEEVTLLKMYDMNDTHFNASSDKLSNEIR